MTVSSELQAAMDATGFGTGRAYWERKAQETEALALLPEPQWIAPVMASTDCLSNWMICSFGNSNEDGYAWFLVTDNVRASNIGDQDFPDDAKMDAMRVAAIINAYRLGLLVRADHQSASESGSLGRSDAPR